jgi:lysophospholipase L1-like esterase
MASSSNLTFLERFNGTLSAWTLYQGGGTVSIVTQDNSPKLKMDDSSGSDNVSATRAFVEPFIPWLLEFDIRHATSSVGVMELLDSADVVIASVILGATANQVDFDTDNASPSSDTFNANVYKQVVLFVDNELSTITCQISGDDSDQDTLKTMIGGSAKSYSGKAIKKIRFRTDNTAQGIIYVDEVRVYYPDYFVFGDSRTDGKTIWSSHPQYSGRLAATENEASPPNHHLNGLLGSISTSWVTNRGHGGGKLYEMDDNIQRAVLDHKPKGLFIAGGYNDIALGTRTLAQMQTDINSMITSIQNAGIPFWNVAFGDVFPGDSINTPTERVLRGDFNAWLKTRVLEIGSLFVNSSVVLTDPANMNAINPTYDTGDARHLNSAGSAVFAQAIYDVFDRSRTVIMRPRNDTARMYPAEFLHPPFPAFSGMDGGIGGGVNGGIG